MTESMQNRSKRSVRSTDAEDVGRKESLMARGTTRPVVRLKSTAGTGVTYVTRKNRSNDADRLALRKYDPVAGGHVLFREER